MSPTPSLAEVEAALRRLRAAVDRTAPPPDLRNRLLDAVSRARFDELSKSG